MWKTDNTQVPTQWITHSHEHQKTRQIGANIQQRKIYFKGLAVVLFKKQKTDKRKIIKGEELTYQMSGHGWELEIEDCEGITEDHLLPPLWF